MPSWKRLAESPFHIDSLPGQGTLDGLVQENGEDEMAKPVIHMGLGMVWGKVWEGQGLYKLCASTGERDFSINLQGPEIEMPGMYKDYPEVWAATKINPRPLKEGLGEFVDWIGKFRGRVVGIGGFKDFSCLALLMRKEIERFPFGDGFLDVGSWVASKQNDPGLTKRWNQKYIRFSEVERHTLDPLEIAKNNLWVVTQGAAKLVPIAQGKKRPGVKAPGIDWARAIERDMPPPPTRAPRLGAIERAALELRQDMLRAQMRAQEVQGAQNQNQMGLGNLAQGYAGTAAPTPMWAQTYVVADNPPTEVADLWQPIEPRRR